MTNGRWPRARREGDSHRYERHARRVPALFNTFFNLSRLHRATTQYSPGTRGFAARGSRLIRGRKRYYAFGFAHCWLGVAAARAGAATRRGRAHWVCVSLSRPHQQAATTCSNLEVAWTRNGTSRQCPVTIVSRSDRVRRISYRYHLILCARRGCLLQAPCRPPAFDGPRASPSKLITRLRRTHARKVVF